MYQIIDGKKIAQDIKDELKIQYEDINKKYKDYSDHCLFVIQVGNDPASSVYVKNKTKAGKYIGLKTVTSIMNENTTQEELELYIDQLNYDSSVIGILVQLPLPSHIDENKILNCINPEKDVDGFNPVNIGKMYIGEKCFKPCTPAGIIELLKRSNIEIEGKNCVVVGRSNIVGKPVAELLIQNNATVTICHSKTKNLKEITKQADILIVAIGKPRFIDSNYVKDGVVVIDVGIHRDRDNKLCGDVNFDSVADHCSYITPVPGGVGPMTIAMLMKNCINGPS